MADFEKASREKLRFTSPQGLLTVEDLWGLPLTSIRGANLDDIAKGLNKELKESNQESFVEDVKKETTVTALKFDVVKRVIEVRLQERAAEKTRAAAAAQKQKILEIIGAKQDKELEGKSVEELRKMLDDAK